MSNSNATDATGLNIFADNCDRYWDAGLPVMPLKKYTKTGGPEGKPTGKEPVESRWQTLQSRMPTEAERAAWKRFHRDGNIGLPLGPQSGLVAIDIDTDDPKIRGIIDRILPPSPWVRVGQKGEVRIYRYEGQPIIRIRYQTEDGSIQSLIEMLGAGSQIVLPPSIHPKTGKPYYANKDLVDVLDEVQSLPPNVEQLLRDAFTKEGYKLGSKSFGAVTNYISTGNRDNTLVAMAGLYANDVIRGKKTLKEACEQIEVAVQQFFQRTYGDNIDKTKGPAKLIEFLIRDVSKGAILPKGWDDGLTPKQKKDWGLDEFSEENESWDVGQIMAFFNAHLETSGVRENAESFTNIVKRVLHKVATNPNLSEIEQDQVIRYIAEVSNKRMSVAAVRRELAAMRAGPISGNAHGEIAEQVAKDMQEIGGEIRFHDGVLWQWRGDCWHELEDSVVNKHIIQTYGNLKAGLRANDHKGILTTVKSLVTAPLQNLRVNGINFVNGFLTEDLELKAHHPDFGMTYTLPYPYLPQNAGKCARWQQMLVDYWGEDPDFAEKVTALGEAICMTMFGRMTQAQQAICLYGVAHSGKSRIMEIVQGLMPVEATVSLPPTVWHERFAGVALVGKLFNFAGELSEFQQIDSAMFKQIVSGETIRAEQKNKPGFNFRPTAAHWFASNHAPKSRDSSDGFTRRWLFLTFNKAFPKDERKIVDYDQIVIAEEREAIAAWAVAHMTRLRNNGFRLTDPSSSGEQREHLENELNSVRDFITSMQDQGKLRVGFRAHEAVPIENNFTTIQTVFDHYRSFCLHAGIASVSSKVFERRMANLQGQFNFRVDKVPGSQGFPVKVVRFVTLIQNNVKAVA